MLHFSYDRVFQTPSFENILLSSSRAVESIDPQSFLRLPVEPSQGNYYEAGMTKAFFGQGQAGRELFPAAVNNYADDDQIQNTTISFPIAFRKAMIYGAEASSMCLTGTGFRVSQLFVPGGQCMVPVTGGLFLGDNATAAETQLSGHFPDSQDQRNTVRGRLAISGGAAIVGCRRGAI